MQVLKMKKSGEEGEFWLRGGGFLELIQLRQTQATSSKLGVKISKNNDYISTLENIIFNPYSVNLS